MKILDRYITASFLGPFIYALLTFTGILILTEWLGMVRLLVRMDVPTLTTLKYLSLKLPSIFFQIVPCALLLAILLGFNGLIIRGEISALHSAGLSTVRICIPIIILASGLSIISFLWGFIGPRFDVRANQVKQEEIEKISPKTKVYGASMLARGDRIYHFGIFDKELKEISLLTITEKRDLPIRRIDACSARWDGQVWHLSDGVIRRFDEKGEEASLTRFKLIKGVISETPDEIWKILTSKKIRSEDMTIPELTDYIRLLKDSGGILRGRLTDLYLKFSLPLANLVIAVLGITLVFSLGHKGRGKISGFGIALIVSFLYWGMTAVGQALGHAGTLPPALAAWITNLLALGSVLALSFVKKYLDT